LPNKKTDWSEVDKIFREKEEKKGKEKSKYQEFLLKKLQINYLKKLNNIKTKY
jgi:hypothetical protein